MIVRIVTVLVFSLIFNACNGQRKKETATGPQVKRTFEMVSIPSIIATPEERADYLAKHYWDKFDFTDTAYVHLPDVTEQALSNYIDILQRVAPETASASIKGMLNKAEADSVVFAYFTDAYEKYLYDPNSPLRNESLYVSVLQHIVDAPVLDDVSKIRPAHLLELALKNRVGAPATDFTYTLADGRKANLYGIKADYVLLFFYNPDCPACKEITDQLAASDLVKDAVGKGRLKILCVYPDEDLTAWKNHLSYLPASWVNSYDESLTLKNDEIYDLKAIPTLYLLDKDKKVLLKDVTFERVIEYLQIR